jgi:hypothetical protein
MLRFLAATTKAVDTQKTIASTLRPFGSFFGSEASSSSSSAILHCG